MVTIQNERNLANVGKAMQLTPDGDVDGEVWRSERVRRLARVPAGVVLLRVHDLQLGRDPFHFPDLRRAWFARKCEIILPVFQPLDAAKESVFRYKA